MIAILFKCLICLIFILVKECEPLKCWACSTVFDPGCEDPFEPEDFDSGTKYFLYSCEDLFHLGNLTSEEQYITQQIFGIGGKPYCRKTIIKAYGTTIVSRSCSFGEESMVCNDYHSDMCTNHACYEDGCNAAPIPRVNILLPISFILRSLYFDCVVWPA